MAPKSFVSAQSLENTPTASPANSACGEEGFPDLFEGPEKTLTLSFRHRRLAHCSLRASGGEEVWGAILKHANCEILSSVESTQVFHTKGDKALKTRGVTAYLLSESSLFVLDDSVILKTCGRTTPLLALEPILDHAVPDWRKRCPAEYLRYASFMRLGYMRPDEQIEPHTSWEQEVAYMDRHLKGEAAVLGTEATSMQHIYVANFLSQGELVDVVSTQVALTDLDTDESMQRYGFERDRPEKGTTPLETHWHDLHGHAKRGVTADPVLDEQFFEPIGYSSNGVFGKHFTTIHVTPQPGCSYASVETSVPMNRDARQRFADGAQRLCTSGTMAVTEFALSASLFSGDAPAVPGFQLRRSTQTSGSGFAAAHHHYERQQPVGASAKDDAPFYVPGTHAANAEVGAAAAPGIANCCPVVDVDEQATGGAAAIAMAEALAQDVQHSGSDAPLALLDLAMLQQQAETWAHLLPRVEPFYAVKCNPQPDVVRALWRLWQEQGWGGFDCASPTEMSLVQALPGIKLTEQVVYANPCKQQSAIELARDMGVKYVVFDNMAELDKMKRLHPKAELVLRVQTDDSLAQCPLSNKFGAAPADCRDLLQRASSLGLRVVGVSFHVGSGCSQVGAFRSALLRARSVFDEAAATGHKFTLLDIGGGFPGVDEEGCVTFADHAKDICEQLEALFPSPELRIIAEPGRFFVAAAQAVLTSVVSVAEAPNGSRYYLNDGLYGSFNCILYDHAEVGRPTVLRGGRAVPDGKLGPCTIFGPTCDGFDVVSEKMDMPALQVGDRLLFHNMGAYTTAASTQFNGFGPAGCVAFRSRRPTA